MTADPIDRFQELLERARRASTTDPTAFVLATSMHGRPSARYVLLKEADRRGFVFFTNYGSRKGADLAANPHAALCFLWPGIGAEVRAEGPVERISAEESDVYFQTRERGKRLGAWASKQSAPLRSQAALILRWLAYALRFLGRRVPRPPFWGGFRIRPHSVAFLQDMGDGTVERRLYSRTGESWRVETTFGPGAGDVARA